MHTCHPYATKRTYTGVRDGRALIAGCDANVPLFLIMLLSFRVLIRADE